MRKRRLLAAGLLSSLLLTGCGVAEIKSTPAVYKVTVVGKSVESEYWKTVFDGAKAAAAEYNIDLDISSPATMNDYQTQNMLIKRAVTLEADAIVLSAMDENECVPAVEEAAGAGIVVVNIDSGAASDAVKARIGTNNYEAGWQAAHAVTESGNNRKKVLVIAFPEGSEDGRLREQGLNDALALDDTTEIVDTIRFSAMDRGAKWDVIYYLSNHPEINVVVALNEPLTVGMGQVIKTLDLGSKVWMVGFDSNSETIDMLETGEVDTLIVQNPYAMGYMGVESAYQILSGQSVESSVDTASIAVNRDNLYSAEYQKLVFPFR